MRGEARGSKHEDVIAAWTCLLLLPGLHSLGVDCLQCHSINMLPSPQQQPGVLFNTTSCRSRVHGIIARYCSLPIAIASPASAPARPVRGMPSTDHDTTDLRSSYLVEGVDCISLRSLGPASASQVKPARAPREAPLPCAKYPLHGTTADAHRSSLHAHHVYKHPCRKGSDPDNCFLGHDSVNLRHNTSPSGPRAVSSRPPVP